MPFVRRSPFWGRKRLPDQELRELFDNVPMAIEALRLVEKCYSLHRGLLRPDDSFSEGGTLYRYDDCAMGLGLERLSDALRELGLEGEHPDWTVMDLVRWYGGLVRR